LPGRADVGHVPELPGRRELVEGSLSSSRAVDVR
jgi:hypothetical protein